VSRVPTHAERIAHNDFLAATSGITTSTDHFLAGIDYARSEFAGVLSAAKAVLVASDFGDVLRAEKRLRAALAACEPTDTDHNREAVDGLCVEESDDAR